NRNGVVFPNRVAPAILTLLQPDFELLAKRDSGVWLHNLVEVLGGVRTARLNNLPRFPFAFSFGQESWARNRTHAFTDVRPLFFAGNVLPKANHKPSPRFFNVTILTSSAAQGLASFPLRWCRSTSDYTTPRRPLGPDRLTTP